VGRNSYETGEKGGIGFQLLRKETKWKKGRKGKNPPYAVPWERGHHPSGERPFFISRKRVPEKKEKEIRRKSRSLPRRKRGIHVFLILRSIQGEGEKGGTS